MTLGPFVDTCQRVRNTTSAHLEITFLELPYKRTDGTSLCHSQFLSLLFFLASEDSSCGLARTLHDFLGGMIV